MQLKTFHQNKVIKVCVEVSCPRSAREQSYFCYYILTQI